MATTRIHHRRVAAGVFAGALLFVPLAGCGDSADPGAADASPEVTETESAPAEDTSAPSETSAPQDTGSAGASGTGGDTNADVDCSGTSCSVTLTGDGAEAEILGTRVALAALADGRATLQVGDREFSCSQGESVSAGPLAIECATVGEDSVTMTATLG